jgi:hypothetical protein
VELLHVLKGACCLLCLLQVKLALSRRLCGLLIGHKGQTVRDFITDSGAAIRVQV